MSYKNIAITLNIISIFIVSVIYFDFLKTFNEYDSYIHFIMYFSLGLLIVNIRDTAQKQIPYKFIFVILIPILTEYIQEFRPPRTYDVKDLYYDYFGLISGMAVCLIYKYVKKT